MLKNTESIFQKTLNKGLNTSKNFFNLQEGQSPACINVEFNKDSSVSKRLGTSTMNTTALESTGGYGMFDLGILGYGGNDSNTKLLLHFNGAASSSTVTDSSPRNYTVNTSGNFQIDTAKSKFGGASGALIPLNVNSEIDYMEYSTDVLAQAAYVTDAGNLEVVDQSQTSVGGAGFWEILGDSGGTEFRVAQSFQLAAGGKIISSAEISLFAAIGSPAGNVTIRIETDVGSLPSGTLANANATVAITPLGADEIIKGTFATPFALNGETPYWLVLQCDNQANDNYWKVRESSSNVYANGNIATSNTGVWTAVTAYDLYFQIFAKLETTDQSQNSKGGDGDHFIIGDVGGQEYACAQSFQLSAARTVSGVAIYQLAVDSGSPTGDWTFRIETDNAGVPSGTLADANATTTVTPGTAEGLKKANFAVPFALSVATTYWLVASGPAQPNDTFWRPACTSTAQGSLYANGNVAESIAGTWTANTSLDLYFDIYVLVDKILQSHSGTVKNQGSYSLKGFAAATESSGKTLTRTISPALDLTNVTTIKFDIYSARTGDIIRLGIKDTGGTVSNKVYTILSNNTWETATWDISGVANADKDSIYNVIITVLDAASANTFYIDNIFDTGPRPGFLNVADNNDWNFGLGDFTIDTWANFASVSTSQAIVGQGSNSNNYWVWQYQSAPNSLVFKNYSGGTLVISVSGLWSPTTSTWYHLAVARQTTNNWYMFVGGTSLTVGGTVGGAVSDIVSLLKIGVNTVTTNNTYFNGWMDEFRITKDSARWTSNFNPFSTEYFSDVIQERRLLCASGTGIYFSQDIGKTWTICQTNRTAAINYFSFVKDYVINTNESYDIPQYWTGSNNVYFANISTAAPACKHSLASQGFLILLNESANKTGFYYVDQNSMFTSAFDSFKLPTERNDELTGGFSLGRILYISSKYKIFRLLYTTGNPDWIYNEIKSFGFIPKTIKKVNISGMGEVVIGMDWSKKIRIFDGSNDEVISDIVSDNNGITPFYLNNINDLNLNKCWAEDDKKAQVYRLHLVYGSSSTISYSINFNYRSGALYPENNRPFQSGVLAKDTADASYMLACDYNGRIHQINSGNTDSGTAVDENYISPILYRQTPSSVHKSQVIDLFFSVTSSGTIYYEDRNQFDNYWSGYKEITLINTISSLQIRQTIDISKTQNVYQFKLSSSANTASPWELNLVDYEISGLGIGKP